MMSADIRLPGTPVSSEGAAEPGPWLRRPAPHAWIAGVVAGLLFAAAAVALYVVIINVVYGVLIGAATGSMVRP